MHGNPQLMNSPGGKGCETNITKASLHPFQTITMIWYAQNRLVSMSVCIRIEGFDGKWWQGKTILCIPNKPSSCFRWQRMAVLCHLFCQEQRKWMQSPKNKSKNLHPEKRKWLLSMARFTDGIAQRSVYNPLRNSINIKAPAVSPLVLYDSE